MDLSPCFVFFRLASTVLIGPWPSLMDILIHRHLVGLLDDQSNARPLPKQRTTQHRNTQTHIHAPSRIRTWNLNVQAVIDSTCLRHLSYWDWPLFCSQSFILVRSGQDQLLLVCTGSVWMQTNKINCKVFLLTFKNWYGVWFLYTACCTFYATIMKTVST
jgi:hypothetical protein